MNYCQLNVFNSRLASTACHLIPALNLTNSILNNIVFLVISLAIDILMIIFTNKNLERKLRLSHDPKHINEAVELKKNITKMILTNGIVFFLSHIPEFTFTFAFVIFKSEFGVFCFYFLNCEKLVELTQTLTFLPISLNFFIFLRFDHHFRESFLELAKRFSCKKNG